ncbi:unnamed protein product [Choristocarpus tenellus]
MLTLFHPLKSAGGLVAKGTARSNPTVDLSSGSLVSENICNMDGGASTESLLPNVFTVLVPKYYPHEPPALYTDRCTLFDPTLPHTLCVPYLSPIVFVISTLLTYLFLATTRL